ncbi:MAG: type IV secretory system conjugative DNA transfer family protein, partial [Minisyncoccia bacterium]
IEYIPSERVTDVVYFAPFDTQFPISFNVLEDVEPDLRHLVMAGLMASFKKIWPDSFSARMEYILANTLLALLEYPEATLLGVNRMLAEKDYRDDVIKHITDSSVKAFWVDEYNKWDPRYAKEAGAAIQNKIGQFTSNPLIRNIIGQKETSFDLRHMMDNQKILLVNLSKGQIGESNANLLGGMLITKLYLAAMSRADVGASGIKNLPPFFFFVDEFQNFANESFADILAEARKYKLNLTVAHQYVDQMQEEVASAIFGNVGTMITFRIGATDAEVFEKQFAPTFTAEDIVNLGKYQIYLSLMIDGIGSRPFSAGTLAPIEPQAESMKQHIIANSRYEYAAERHVVEAEIEKWYEPIKKPVKKRINNPKDINKAGEKKTFKAAMPSSKKTQKDDLSSLVSNVHKKKESSSKNVNKKSRDFDSPAKKAIKEVSEKEA